MSRTARRLIATAVAVAALSLSGVAIAGAAMDMDEGTTARDSTYADVNAGR